MTQHFNTAPAIVAGLNTANLSMETGKLIGPAFDAGQTNSLDKAQQMLGQSMKTYSEIKPDIDLTPAKTIGGGAMSSLGGAAAGAAMGGTSAGPWGAAAGAVIGGAAYYLS